MGRTELGEVQFVLLDSPPVDGRDGSHHSVSPAEFLRVGDIKEETQVTGSPKFVKLDHARFENRLSRGRLRFECVNLIARIAELACDGLRIGFDLLQLFRLEIALDFQPS